MPAILRGWLVSSWMRQPEIPQDLRAEAELAQRRTEARLIRWVRSAAAAAVTGSEREKLLLHVALRRQVHDDAMPRPLDVLERQAQVVPPVERIGPEHVGDERARVHAARGRQLARRITFDQRQKRPGSDAR